MDIPMGTILRTIQAVAELLKERFPNLTVTEVTRLSNNVVRTVVKTIEKED